jgi:Domain of unknown function (DUF4365)
VGCELSDRLFRSHDGRDDFGIDAELEVATASPEGPRRASGRLARAQIRGRSGLHWTDGFVAHPVKRRTFNLWLRVGLPVFLMLWDGDRDEVYWTTPYGTHPETDEDPVRLFVPETRLLSRGLPGVSEVMDLWQSSGGPVGFETTPAAYENFLELRDAAEGDWWLSAGSELTDRLRRFIAHVDGLALALGIVRPALRPIRDWSAIDRLVRPDDYGVDLHYGTLRLAVGEAGMTYFETLESLKRVVEDGSQAIRDYRPAEVSQWLDHWSRTRRASRRRRSRTVASRSTSPGVATRRLPRSTRSTIRTASASSAEISASEHPFSTPVAAALGRLRSSGSRSGGPITSRPTGPGGRLPGGVAGGPRHVQRQPMRRGTTASHRLSAGRPRARWRP